MYNVFVKAYVFMLLCIHRAEFNQAVNLLFKQILYSMIVTIKNECEMIW